MSSANEDLNETRKLQKMKTTLKNIALVVLLAAGGVGTGIATLSGSRKSSSLNSVVSSMSDTAMVSMQSDSHSCEKCTSSDHSKCVLGSCSVSTLGLDMVADPSACEQCSNGDHSQCTLDRCTSGAEMMKMTDASAKSSEAMSTVQMMSAKMSEAKMAPAMSPVMVDESMAPEMSSGERVDPKGAMVAPKM